MGINEFDKHFPPWEQLSPDDQESKIAIAREELRLLDRAGYQVHRKKEHNTLAGDQAKV
jgi:hypothetical protein